MRVTNRETKIWNYQDLNKKKNKDIIYHFCTDEETVMKRHDPLEIKCNKEKFKPSLIETESQEEQIDLIFSGET